MIDIMPTIRDMTYCDFLKVFGFLYNQAQGKYVKWEAWPKQIELAELFWQHKFIWILKARQLGISEEMAFYAVFVALVEPNSEIIIISKKKDDAKYFLKKRAMTKLITLKGMEWEGQPLKWPSYEPLEGMIKFDNGSWIEAASSDNEEVRSRTPRLVIFDEARSFAASDAEELMSGIKPSVEEQPRSQIIVASTARPGTWFNEQSKDIKSGDLGGWKYFFMPGNAKPERTEEWYKEAIKRWYDQKLFYREYPRNEEDCFAAREGLVYDGFDPKRHVHGFDVFFRHKYIIVYDHGRQHPAVMLFCLYDKHSDHLYVFDEVFEVGLEITEVCYKIRQKMNFYKKNLNAPRPQLRIADTACFAKDGRRPVAEVMRNILGIHFKKSIKHDRMASIDLLRARFSYGGISIDPRCKHTIAQVENLRWKYDYDRHAKTHEEHPEKPVDIDNDCTDCLEYVTAELHAVPKPKQEKPEDLHFNPRFNRHKRSLRARLMGQTSPDYTSVEDYTPEQLSAWEGL